MALPTMVRAALPLVPGVNQLPGIKKSGGDFADITRSRTGAVIDAAHVAAYASVCGFEARDRVPLPYVHMLAFPLHMDIMTSTEFPYPAIGTVHVANSIHQLRPLTAGERLDITVTATNLRPHPKGQVFDMLTTVHSRGELVWEETSTFLRRGRGSDDAPAGSTFPEAPAHGITWKLPGDLGRRYAGVSGDHNPIHLYPLTAKAFGFPRQIAHGMWSMARCVGALENRLPDAVTVAVAFKKPILLPGTVAFGSRAVDDGWAFSLSSPKSGAPHLAGLAAPA